MNSTSPPGRSSSSISTTRQSTQRAFRRWRKAFLVEHPIGHGEFGWLEREDGGGRWSAHFSSAGAVRYQIDAEVDDLVAASRTGAPQSVEAAVQDTLTALTTLRAAGSEGDSAAADIAGAVGPAASGASGSATDEDGKRLTSVPTSSPQASPKQSVSSSSRGGIGVRRRERRDPARPVHWCLRRPEKRRPARGQVLVSALLFRRLPWGLPCRGYFWEQERPGVIADVRARAHTNRSPRPPAAAWALGDCCAYRCRRLGLTRAVGTCAGRRSICICHVAVHR